MSIFSCLSDKLCKGWIKDLGAIFLAVLVSTNTTQAADYTVTSLDDDGSVGTLRWAITTAQGTAEADRILFDIGGTFNIGSILPTITTEIEIDSNGQNVILDGVNNGSRGFVVSAGGDVTMSGFTLQNFTQTANLGGAAAVINAGVLTLNNMNFNNNTAAAGGALYIQNNGSQININSSFFTGNNADTGGVIFGQSGQTQININDSQFDANSAFQGGVIAAINGSDITVDQTDFTNNRALELSTNIADSGEGAVMWLRNGGTVTNITNSNLIGNEADREAGAILASIGVPLTVEDSIIDGNTAGDDGGAFQLQVNADLILRRSEVTNNSTATTGGGVNMANTNTSVTVEDSTISGNTAVGAGGGINSQESDIILIRSTISGNESDANGGGVNANSGSLSIQNSTSTDNTTTGTGGGVNVVTGANTTIDSATIAFNEAGRGGGINFSEQGGETFDLLNTILSNNIALTNPGTENIFGDITSLGFNLLDDASLDAPQLTDILNGIADLQPLADNGGPTLTHWLGELSQAIDNGGTSLLVDQRGFPRFDGMPDIGAVEIPTPSSVILLLVGSLTLLRRHRG